MKEVLFFVHIPKTAGTSFRKALENNENFKMFYDYGLNSPETSEELKTGDKSIDTSKIDGAFLPDKINVLCGHVFFKKYGSMVNQKNVISILRNPIERIISEYQHLERHYGYSRSFLEFIRSREQINKQSKMLNGVIINKGGLFGITSHYKNFIDHANYTLGWDLKAEMLNVAPKVDNNKRYAFQVDDINEAFSLNRKDISLLLRLARSFKRQLQDIGINTTPVKDAKFSCRIDGGQEVVGWVSKGEQDSYFVGLQVNGETRAIIGVDQRRQDVYDKGYSKSVDCGFRYPLILLGAKPGDEVRVSILDAPRCAKNLQMNDDDGNSHE